MSYMFVHGKIETKLAINSDNLLAVCSSKPALPDILFQRCNTIAGAEKHRLTSHKPQVCSKNEIWHGSNWCESVW